MPNRSLEEFRAELAAFASTVNSAIELVDEARKAGATNLAGLREWLREHPVNLEGDSTADLAEFYAHIRRTVVDGRRIAAAISVVMAEDDVAWDISRRSSRHDPSQQE